ncbi:MAG TPA: signal peptidase II, partial [Streptosporangiaceae bacterium]|nr:signal peptidase II [Streptosporangiaceae bacterium]
MPGATDSPGPPSPPGRRRLALLLAIAAGVYVADVVSKVIVVATLSHRPPLHVIDGVLTLVVLRNSGAAFS